MTADELIARLDYLGASVIWTDDKPRLAFPPGTPLAGLREELAPAMAQHRAAVLERFNRVYEGFVCGECGADVFVREPADIWQVCGRYMCPAWRPGFGSDWIPRARSYEQWRRGQVKEQEQRDAEGIPD